MRDFNRFPAGLITPETDHRFQRPYIMMHEAQELFSGWFNELVKAAEVRPMPIWDAQDLITGTNIISSRLKTANTAVQLSLVEPQLGLLRAYTSMDAGAFMGIIDEKQRLTRFLNDTIDFFVGLPISVAADTWAHSERPQEPVGRVVKEMLGNPTYIACCEKLATTGFGVYRAEFAQINPRDYSRSEHRKRLGAADDDPEIIRISRRDGRYIYELSEWVMHSIADKLKEQNKRWPDDQELSRLEAGNMIELPGPISAGCPVRLVSIGPLCEYLSEQIRA